MSPKHVAVLMGGWSSEREVSLRSGAACASALERKGYRVTRVDVKRDIANVLSELKPDVALVMLHGHPGEDGTIQGVLETLAIPYTHSGVLSSSLAMQKDVAKIVMAAAGVPVAPGLTLSRAEIAKGHVMEPPYVIKPVADGSSVGVFIVTKEHEHPPQELFREDWPHGDRLLVEKYVAGRIDLRRDPGTGVWGHRNCSFGKILRLRGKVFKGASKHVLPAPILPFVYQEVRRLALAAHVSLGCRGISRADFRYDDHIEGTVGLVCLEVNTQPGMTETSLVPELAAYAGVTFDELVQWMVEDASLDR